MRTERGGLQKRLRRLEFCQREAEFKDLASVLVHYEELTEAQFTVILPRLIRLFDEELRAGVPLEECMDKLPEAFKLAVYQQVLADPIQEDP